MKLYVYDKCSTCKKAISFLKRIECGVIIENIKKNPPTEDELFAMLTFFNGNKKKLINTSGLLYKELNLKEKIETMETKELISLLSKNGMLIKRPFLISQNRGLVGFKEEEWQQFFKPKLRP